MSHVLSFSTRKVGDWKCGSPLSLLVSNHSKQHTLPTSRSQLLATISKDDREASSDVNRFSLFAILENQVIWINFRSKGKVESLGRLSGRWNGSAGPEVD